MVSLDPLIQLLFFLPYSFLLLIFLPLLLLNLLLQFLLHLESLLILLLLNDVFLVSSTENRALFLKSDIKTTLCNSAARHYCREVLLRLTR